MPRLSKYPWHRAREGESFFMPCLDLQTTMLEGVHAAQRFFGPDVKVKATPAIYKGLLGVMFKLRRLPPD